jgi:hypothetical protein
MKSWEQSSRINLSQPFAGDALAIFIRQEAATTVEAEF